MNDKKDVVTNIKICQLPYQSHPFVHGVRDGKDVWLRDDGEWTENEYSHRTAIPLNDGVSIVNDFHNPQKTEVFAVESTSHEPCMFDHIDPNLATGMSCPCPKCSPRAGGTMP